jgi:Nickel responsive protein SCO4226-like
MATIIVEHRFEDRPFDIERYQRAQIDNRWCLETHRVKHLQSFVSQDRRRMICVFEAPDAEAVRQTAVELGYSYDSAWTATIVD